jgi:single-strand DNA-binding protein
MVNRVFLIGNAGKDAELRNLDSGQKVASFSLATSESYKDRAGEWQQKTEWHNVVLWGSLADRAAKIEKGETVYVDGKIQSRTYEKDGVQKKVTDIVASYFRVITKRESVASDANKPAPSSMIQETTEGVQDDLPF